MQSSPIRYCKSLTRPLLDIVNTHFKVLKHQTKRGHFCGPWCADEATYAEKIGRVFSGDVAVPQVCVKSVPTMSKLSMGSMVEELFWLWKCLIVLDAWPG